MNLPSPGRIVRPLRVLAALAVFWALATELHAGQSIARIWDEQALQGIRTDTPHPPAQARNLFSFSVCMFDAWAAYGTNAEVGFIYRDKHSAPDIAAARSEAISYAVYRMMKERHFYSKTSTNMLASDDALMASLGYDTNNVSRDPSTPAGVGNLIYDAVSAYFINDGARQTNGTQANPYPDYPIGQGAYVYINPALAVALEGIDDGQGDTVVNINHWQRLQIYNGVDQNGFPTGPIQSYLGVQWLGVRPFSLARIDPTKAWIDPGPPPFVGTGTATVQSEVVAVIQASSQLTPDDGVTMDISPGAYGNNSLDALDGNGFPMNPVTGQPYAPNVVKRGDFARILAEFWADGPKSETPPGHWNVLANLVSDNTNTVKRIGGAGPLVDDLEWDVKLYFAVNAAVHDAACAAWALKRYYDGWRPIGMIRYMAGKGQSTDPAQVHYNPLGLPLITNLIEVVTPATVASGRHAGLTPGKIAILAWPGAPADPTNQYSGVHWIHGDFWNPYQRANFVTPAFPGYISGHSTFSRSAAEVLAGFTGSTFFPGGIAGYSFPADTGLKFEKGPSQPLTLQWATYFDAADQAGISRIWGGIHVNVDNLVGRRVGSEVGKGVWSLVQKYFDGSIATTPALASLTSSGSGSYTFRSQTHRGLYYRLQAGPTPAGPFNDLLPGSVQALESSIAVTNAPGGLSQFYRSIQSVAP
jgi:hypothetical protein